MPEGRSSEPGSVPPPMASRAADASGTRLRQRLLRHQRGGRGGHLGRPPPWELGNRLRDLWPPGPLRMGRRRRHSAPRPGRGTARIGPMMRTLTRSLIAIGVIAAIAVTVLANHRSDGPKPAG